MHNFKRLATVLAVSIIISSCQTAQISAKHLAEPGSTILEVYFIEGLPKETKEGVQETLLVYGQYIDVIRNGRLSHRIDGGTFGLSVDSIVSDNKPLKTFYISLSEEKDKDVYYQRYKQIVERALNARGLTVSANPKSADTIVDFAFSQSKDRETKIDTELIPVTNYSFSNANFFTNRGSATGWISTTSITQQQRIFSKTTIHYDRTFVINLWSQNKTKEIARVTLQSSGQSSDPRQNFSALAAASIEFIDRDTQGEFQYLIALNDPLIAFVQGDPNALDHYKGEYNILRGKKLDFTNPVVQQQVNEAGDAIGTILAGSGSAYLVEAILKVGVSPNSFGHSGKPMLVYAIDSKSTNVVKTLLNHGADPTKTYWKESSYTNGISERSTPLTYAKEKGTEEIKVLFSSLEAKRTPAVKP